MIKINTDGSFDASDAKSGIGGVVRNEFGDLIMAFSIPSRLFEQRHGRS